MEAAGVEPASEKPRYQETTCVSRSALFAVAGQERAKTPPRLTWLVSLLPPQVVAAATSPLG